MLARANSFAVAAMALFCSVAQAALATDAAYFAVLASSPSARLPASAADLMKREPALEARSLASLGSPELSTLCWLHQTCFA